MNALLRVRRGFTGDQRVEVQTFDGRHGCGADPADAFSDLVDRCFAEQQAIEMLLGPETRPAGLGLFFGSRPIAPGAVIQYQRTVGIDWAKGADITVYRCCCGFECDTSAAIVAHLKAHGVTAVRVEPIRTSR